MTAKQILFVCTGNSCRSVMAQYLLQHRLRQAGVESVQVGSAGVFAMEGMSPTPETQRVLQAEGISCDAHRARPLTADLVQTADLIFVMEAFQLEEVVRRFPPLKDKVHLLKAYGTSEQTSLTGREPQLSIPDPIGKPLEVYEVCFSEIRDAVDHVAGRLGLKTS